MRQNTLFQSREWYVRSNVYLWNGLLHLISVLLGCDSTFSSYPRRLNKVAFTPEDFRVLNAIAQLRLQMNVTKVEKFVRFSELWRRV